MDTLTPEERSAQMARVRSKNTQPELVVRRLVHSQGYRYRLHKPDLPGKPDLAFVSRKKVIFVNGCFWHGHKCSLGRTPKSRVEFWVSKIEKNRARDAKNIEELRKAGWNPLVLWECQLKDREALKKLIVEFLDNNNA